MVSRTVFAAAALSMVSGAYGIGCRDPTATIESPADATALASCSSVPGTVVVSTTAGGTINIDGPTSIGGDLIVENNGAVIGLSSSSLQSIGGAFKIHNTTLLSTLKMTVLNSVGSIDWQTLPQLGSLTFGTPGVVKAKSVVVADTFLSSLDGLNIVSLADMDINNNKRLTKFSSQLGNLTNVLRISANGLALSVDLPNLTWIANMTISNVTEFSVPSLAAVNGSMRFDSNYFESFNAPNLTAVQTSDVSFVSNPQLTNITAPGLKAIGGSLTIANNTALQKVDGFQALTQVGGAVALRGSFNSVTLTSLNDVKGAFTATSTANITSSCSALQKLKSGGQIQGKYECTSSNSNANNSTASGDSGAGGGSSNGSSGAGSIGANMAIVSLAALGVVFTFL